MLRRLLWVGIVMPAMATVALGGASAADANQELQMIAAKWRTFQSDLLTCHRLATTRPVNIPKLRSTALGLEKKWNATIAAMGGLPDELAEPTPRSYFLEVVDASTYVFAVLSQGPSGSDFCHIEGNFTGLNETQKSFLQYWRFQPPLVPLRTNWFQGAVVAIKGGPPAPRWKRLNLQDYATDCAEEGFQSREETLSMLRDAVHGWVSERREIDAMVRAGKSVPWRDHFTALYCMQGVGGKCVGISKDLQSALNVFPKAQFNAWARQSQTKELSTPESREADRILTIIQARLVLEETR